MATVTHYIYSHYDPKDRSKLERQTGQVESGVSEEVHESEHEEDPWQTESSFSAQRRIALAPRFVPAIVSYDEINDMIGVPHDLFKPPPPKRGDDVAEWYRSLTRSGTTTPVSSTERSTPDAGSESTRPTTPTPVEAKGKHRPSKKDWFISRVLNAEPSATPPTTPPTTTLADILSREPLPSEKPLAPPVFLAIGPSNKGFEMLQRSGWSEGETLGAHVVRRATPSTFKSKRTIKREEGELPIKHEEREVRYGTDGEVSEMRKVEVVDLTLSDEEEESVEEATTPTETPKPEDLPSEPAGKALLTPLPTILKSDRLGIGLKAKTAGPYKGSKKRVTHGQAALAAHTRAAEEMRLKKRKMGRGARAFARQARAESEQRRQLLARLHER
ncbi:unnamed protein product [Somion occarium]|uniref:G-patch domain-containing protein n=1 Tax=Somion occarium TaxID=3059160 RepID=A0ABP1DYF0_9APHY